MIDPRFYKLASPLTLGEALDGLDVVGPEGAYLEEMISAPANLASSQPGHITFFQNKRLKGQLETAKASACFVPEKLAAQLGERHIIPIISQTPRAHFARFCQRFVSVAALKTPADIAASAKVHPTAIIGAGAVIGENVEIGAFTVIGHSVQIGAGSKISPHAHIEFAHLGEDCRIKTGAVIGGSGFGVAKDERGILDIPHLGRVIIGDRVSIGSQSCMDRGQLGDTVLGNDVKLDNFVQIAHNVQVGAGSMMAGHVGISGSCVIGKGCQFGGRVGLADHIIVGDGASLAANAGVMHDIPAGEMWSGIPAMPIREHMRMVSATRKLIKKPEGGS